MRTDKQDLPFKDKRVRQALMMATDFQSLKNNLYRGEAEILVWPFIKGKGYESAYVPMEELLRRYKSYINTIRIRLSSFWHR
jgi:ABC-type oligopeptide transport system substrate-binding subunit